MFSRTRTMIGVSLLQTLLIGSALARDGYQIRVRGTGQKLGQTPVIVELPVSIELGGNFSLHPRESGPALPANVFEDSGKSFLGAILDQIPAQGERTFDLVQENLANGGVSLLVNHDKTLVQIGGQTFTQYITNDGPKPYYFPLIGPSDASMTRGYPMEQIAGETSDHPHHRSFWFTHGSVNKVDFWSEFPNHGTIRETSRRTFRNGDAVGVIRTTDDWIGPLGKKILEDERVIRVYNTERSRVLDFDVTLKATVGPVTFGDTKEGMFGLRVASSMDLTAKKGGRIINAEGVTDKATWGLASAWVDYTGPVAGKTVGVAILNHPESFRYPTTWHVRDYGLFAANPFGWHDFGRKESGDYLLLEGQSIQFRYRVILHEGDAAAAALPSAFEGYRNPPRVTVEPRKD